MPIDRRGGDASRNVSLGSSLLGAAVSPQIGAASGASKQSSRVGSTPPPLTAHEATPIVELSDAAFAPSDIAPLYARASPSTATAVAKAMVACGVVRDDGIWVTECAWCNRVRSITGDWQALDPAVRAAMPGERTHGICPRCGEACIARASGATVQ